MQSPEREPTNKKRSERTCAGCGRADAPSAFLRVVLGAPVPGANGASEGGGREIAVDVAQSGFGRGAHVHPSVECLTKACKGGFSRSFKTKVCADVAELSQQIEEAYERRILGLVVGGRRAGRVAIGHDAACEALARGAPLAVLACDAGSAVTREVVSRAIGEGRAVVWKDKCRLGALFGRDEVAIFAVTEPGIAEQIQKARSRSEACRRREVR
jgi:predicted RNA-binding protein YlxR (DUF448 family)